MVVHKVPKDLWWFFWANIQSVDSYLVYVCMLAGVDMCRYVTRYRQAWAWWFDWHWTARDGTEGRKGGREVGRYLGSADLLIYLPTYYLLPTTEY